MTRTFIYGAVIATADASDTVLSGGVLVDGGAIAAVVPAGAPEPAADLRVDACGRALVPGFVQTHVHGCQTLFRGAADDLPLLDWLKLRIWPFEAAHDAASLAASVDLTALELLRGGTTAALTMETVRHTASAFEAYSRTPLRAVVGKCLMDQGEGVPRALIESPRAALDEALALARSHPPGAGRVRACLAPRFALSCSEGLLRDVAAEAAARGLLVHTHGAEQRAEVELVERATGRRNVAYLDHVGLLRENLRLAHCVHLDPAEIERFARSGAHVLHCPSSNLKLGSGIAPIARYFELGIPVSLGADGAPCNNSLDQFREMRLAALLQKALFGPTALPARRALRLATIDGARALGMEREIGSIEVGKRADLVEIDVGGPHHEPAGDVLSRVVYAAERADVVRTWVDGAVVVERGEARYDDGERVLRRAREQAALLFSRA